METCESCERAPVEIQESCDDPDLPYRLCLRCHARLLKRSLRPVEWFNLAKRHGSWVHHLHGDFYDEDGVADQPEEEVEDPHLWPAPTLEGSRSDLQSLFDFTCTRWNAGPEVMQAWKAFPEAEVMEYLLAQYRRPIPAGFRNEIIAIVVYLLGPRAAWLVEEAWSFRRSEFGLFYLVSLGTQCMPIEDVLSRALPELESLAPGEMRSNLHLLHDLPSETTLRWIETHAASPVVDTWGTVAARCDPSADRLRGWIQGGRPLSLVALDTLYGQILATERGNANFEWKPKVHSLLNALVELRSLDPVPRVRDTIDAILNRVI